MSNKLLDKLDELSNDDEDEEQSPDTQNVNESLGDDEKYWKSRNQTKKVQKTLRDDEDED